MIIEIMILVSCVIAIKFRSVTRVIIWLEAARNIANAFVPHQYGAFEDTYSVY